MVAEHRVNRHRLLLTGNDQASRSVAMQISSSVIDANLAINDLSSLCILVVCRTRSFYYAAVDGSIGIEHFIMPPAHC